MRRILPVLLRRPDNLISVPEAAPLSAARRPGFLHGDPQPWAPAACARLRPEPWTSGCDLLLAPAPRPGDERDALLGILDEQPPERPVVLYERDWPLWPNALVHGEAGGEDSAIGRASAALRAYRSAFRHAGAGYAEALQILPAARTADLLRGSPRAARGGRGPLENRRFLTTALDHQRSLPLVCGGAPRLQPARRVVVLAPHFDDEVIGAGGAILDASASGAEVRLIWLTDGARGVPGVAAAESSRLRKEEARAAAAELGVRDLHFLDAPEQRLCARGPWRAALRSLLREFAPERVHLVWWMDNHVDHYETSRLLRAAWPAGLSGARIAATGTWAPLPGAALLALNAAAQRRKEAALRRHASQLRAVDYLRAARGLTAWNARDLPGAEHAESYWETEAETYFAAFRASGADRRIWLG